MESSDIPTLSNGNGQAGSIFGGSTSFASKIANFFSDLLGGMDNGGDFMDRVGGTVEQVNNASEEANKKETKTEQTEFVRTSYDEKTGNQTWVRKDIYDQRKKESQ